ncbi:MAG: alpha/beta hydrolase [Solirubrobacterales bacterium]
MSEGTVAGPAGEIAWRSVGDGPPLVLVNGYAATAADWDPGFLAALGGRSEVFCPDNRGMGGSGGSVDGLSVEAMAADLVALLDALELPSVDLAGWSMGGFVAQEVAALAPERVRKLVLLATSGGGPDAVPSTVESWRALTDHGGTPGEQARRLLDLLFPAAVAERVYADFGDIVAAARAALDPKALSAQEAAMIAWLRGPAAERLAAIRAPALIATGTEDLVIPAANSALLAGALADSWLARFPGGGHAFMAQEPVRVAALITAFLDR